MLYKVEITEVFGPFCGQGGYGVQRGTALSKRSVARAVRQAREAFRQHKPNGEHFGGGVPVAGTFKIWANGQLIKDEVS